MTKHRHEFLNSSSIQDVEYDEATKDMHINFVSGGKYCFKGVDPDDFHAFKDAKSPGTLYHSAIRRKYKSEKVE